MYESAEYPHLVKSTSGVFILLSSLVGGSPRAYQIATTDI